MGELKKNKENMFWMKFGKYFFKKPMNLFRGMDFKMIFNEKVDFFKEHFLENNAKSLDFLFKEKMF